MKTKSYIDPELYLLRTVARTLDGRHRQEIESARFNLYAAFESRDPDTARRWASTLRVGILTMPSDTTDERTVRSAALAALDTIDTAIGGGA